MSDICRICINAITNGSLVALVQALRACDSCRQEIAAWEGVGQRMLLLAGQRFGLHLIADEWEAQNKKEWIQEQEARYVHFGLRVRTELDKHRNWVVHLLFDRAPGGGNLDMSVTSCWITAALQRAGAALREVTAAWSTLPGVMETDPTGRIIFKPKPDFVEEA